MTDISTIFRNRKFVPELLTAYGFTACKNGFVFTAKMPQDGFTMTVTVTDTNKIKAVVTDTMAETQYTLHLVSEANGAFVCAVRSAYEAMLLDIAEKCTEIDVFKYSDTKKIIAYVKEKYGTEPEYLWSKSPNNAIFRIQANQKWFGVIMSINAKKVGLKTDREIEIIDLTDSPENILKKIDGKKAFPAYHMNKKHWYTLLLDGTVPIEELKKNIDESYETVLKK